MNNLKHKKEKLINAIQDLLKALKTSNKTGPAEYYERLRSEINNISAFDELTAKAKEITTSASISQYADFDSLEENLFNRVYLEAKDILQVSRT